MIVALLASVYVSLGMRAYARIQKFCFYGGLVGLVIMPVLLLVNSNADFVSAFNSAGPGPLRRFGQRLPADRPGRRADAGRLRRLSPSGRTLLLIPFLVFFNLWSNWGATLYGEVRGASDFRKNIYAMGGALMLTSIVAAILLAALRQDVRLGLLLRAANAAFRAGNGPDSASGPTRACFAAFFFDSPILQFILVALLSLWFFGWVGYGLPVFDSRRLRHGVRPGVARVRSRRPRATVCLTRRSRSC